MIPASGWSQTSKSVFSLESDDSRGLVGEIMTGAGESMLLRVCDLFRLEGIRGPPFSRGIEGDMHELTFSGVNSLILVLSVETH
jgi:hypothetical protein